MGDLNPVAIGIDLGATKIAGALVSERGEVLASRQVLTQAAQGVSAVLDRIAALANELAGSASGRRLLGIGIGSPGQVDPHSGVVRNAVNLGWEEVALVEQVGSRLFASLPVWIQKDANASALGEHIFGAAVGCRDFVYLGLGSGLGGGILANGRLVEGANRNAAEVGHLSLDPQGVLCNCGNRGCAETLVSGPGLLALAKSYLREARFPSGLSPDQDLQPAQVVAAANAADPLAQAAIEDVGRGLGIVIASCVALLNPSRIVIGGGLGLAAFDSFVPAARREVEVRTLPSSHADLEIVPSSLTSPSVGAAALAWYYNSEAERR